MTSIAIITAGLGIMVWIKGYRNSDHVPSDLTLDFLARSICPPKPLYIICGAPKSKTYPDGVMTAWAFSLQLLGVGLVINTLYYLFLAQSQIDVLINLICIVTGVYVLTYWLTIKRVYK